MLWRDVLERGFWIDAALEAIRQSKSWMHGESDARHRGYGQWELFMIFVFSIVSPTL